MRRPGRRLRTQSDRAAACEDFKELLNVFTQYAILFSHASRQGERSPSRRLPRPKFYERATPKAPLALAARWFRTRVLRPGKLGVVLLTGAEGRGGLVYHTSFSFKEQPIVSQTK